MILLPVIDEAICNPVNIFEPLSAVIHLTIDKEAKEQGITFEERKVSYNSILTIVRIFRL